MNWLRADIAVGRLSGGLVQTVHDDVFQQCGGIVFVFFVCESTISLGVLPRVRRLRHGNCVMAPVLGLLVIPLGVGFRAMGFPLVLLDSFDGELWEPTLS